MSARRSFDVARCSRAFGVPVWYTDSVCAAVSKGVSAWRSSRCDTTAISMRRITTATRLFTIAFNTRERASGWDGAHFSANPSSDQLLAIPLALEGFRAVPDGSFRPHLTGSYRLLPPRLGRQRCHVEGCRPHSNRIASWLCISCPKVRIQRCATSLDAPQPMVSGKLTHHGHCQSRVRPCRLPAGPRGRTASRHVASAWRASTSQRLLTHHSSCLPADVHFEVGTLNL